MPVTQDFLGELLRPAAAAPKQPTSRQRAAVNRLGERELRQLEGVIAMQRWVR